MRGKNSLVIGLLGVLFAAVAGYTSRSFPTLHADEVFIYVHGLNGIEGHGQRYSLYDNVFAPSVYEMRDAFAEVSLNVYNAWVGFYAKGLPRTHQFARASSVAAGALAIAMIGILGSEIAGTAGGIMCALLLFFAPIFFLASCVVNSQPLLLFVVILDLWLIHRIPPSFRWKFFIIGGIAGLALGVHPNAVVSFCGILAYGLVWTEPTSRAKTLFTSLLGFGVGSAFIYLTIDLPKFLLAMRSFWGLLYHPPILTYPWPWRAFFNNIVRAALPTTSFEFDETLLSQIIHQSTLVQGIGIGLCLLGSFAGMRWRSKDIDGRRYKALWVGWMATVLAMTLILARQESYYKLAFYPYLLPLAGLFLTVRVDRAKMSVQLLRGLSSIFIVLGFLIFWRGVGQYRKTVASHESLVERVKSRLSDLSLKVMGPAVLWFDWKPTQFRDIGALMYSHWYTGGRRDLRLWLKPWQPDILILDEPSQKVFIGTRLPITALQDYFRCPVESLGSIDTGQPFYGTWQVFRIRWQPSTTVVK